MDNMNNHVYPHIEDNLFNLKLAQKEEFNAKSDNDNKKDITTYADKICNESFELRPHQIFVKNFLSLETPYNSLLLYHGLGTGKTCSAINIAEDMRKYSKEIQNINKILIIASPNVQDNFKKQIFNENNLQEIESKPGYFKLDSCIGNDLLNEINPSQKPMEKSTIVNEANRIINKNYEFMGYTKLAYLIDNQFKKKNLSQLFNGRLIIIDEVHNIRMNEDDENKRIVKSLYKLVENTENVRFLFLSATPMYNSYREILWLVNLMNANDKRTTLKEKDIFDANGSFKIDENGIETGKINFINKITGYISYIKGENPYSFPYRIYPFLFEPAKSLLNNNTYPRIQYNGDIILEPIKHIDVYLNTIQNYQLELYNFITQLLFDKKDDDINIFNLENKGYMRFQRPLSVLNIAFPNKSVKQLKSGFDFQNVTISDLVGKSGLQNIIKDLDSFPYQYNKEYLENKRSIFHSSRINNYSSKINSIVESISSNKGIHLVYSQFIYGGIIPIVCALEERGIQNYNKDKEFVSKSYKKSLNISNTKHKYIIITGNNMISGNIKEEINQAISEENKNGDVIKVILISKAGSEGIDFKNIRNVHILEPWYNMNRTEQIIGRAVRSCSHKKLPFSNRNVNIYMYGTKLPLAESDENEKEAIDMYIYRSAEYKAKKIGVVSRVLKETSVDCLLHSNNADIMDNIQQIVKQELPNNLTIDYQVGDKEYSNICDYLESCQYSCKVANNNEILNIDDILNNEDIDLNKKTYNTFKNSHLQNNIISLKNKIKALYLDKYVYNKVDIIKRINFHNSYHILQIELALQQLTNDKLEVIVDKYNRKGYLIEIEDTYFFQPYKIGNKKISMEHRSIPVFQNRKYIPIKLDKPKKINNAETVNTSLMTKEHIIFDVNKFNDNYNKFSSEHVWNDYIKKSVLDKSENIVLQRYKDYIDILLDDKSKIDDIINELIMNQYLDILPIEELITLLKFYYHNRNSSLNPLVNTYLEKMYFTSSYYDGFVINNGSELVIYSYDKTKNIWNKNNSIYNQLQDEIDNMYKFSSLAIVFGYYYPNKSKKLNFKLKNMNQPEKRSVTGAVCRNLDNIYIQTYLNTLLSQVSEEKQEEFKTLLKNNKKITNKNLCNILELLLRYFNLISLNKKIWFATPHNAIYNKFYYKVTL